MADFALVDPGKSLKTPQSSSVRGILLQSPKTYNRKKDIMLITPEKKLMITKYLLTRGRRVSQLTPF